MAEGCVPPASSNSLGDVQNRPSFMHNEEVAAIIASNRNARDRKEDDIVAVVPRRVVHQTSFPSRNDGVLNMPVDNNGDTNGNRGDETTPVPASSTRTSFTRQTTLNNDGSVSARSNNTPARNSFVAAATRHGNTAGGPSGLGCGSSSHQVSTCNTPIGGISIMRNAAFKHAVNRVKSKIRSVHSGVEHYPELTGTLLSFIYEAGEPLIRKEESVLQPFELLTKKVLIQCPKFSALERILDAHGWDGVEYDIEDKACDFSSLQFALGKLYYSHVWSAAPTMPGSEAQGSSSLGSGSGSGPGISILASDYVNIFQNDRLIGAFCPNILYKLLSTDCAVDLFAQDTSAMYNMHGLASTVGSAHNLFDDDGVTPRSTGAGLYQTYNSALSPVDRSVGGGSASSPPPMSLSGKQASFSGMLKGFAISRGSSFRGLGGDNSASVTPRNHLPTIQMTSPKALQHMAVLSKLSSSDIFHSHLNKSPHQLGENILSPGNAKLTDIHLNRKLVFHGACVLADISGFTKLSASLCDAGLSGLDDLHNAASGFLGKYVQIVYSHNGDVISFAGDALICIFTPEEDQVLDATPRRGVDSPKKPTLAQQMVECNKRALACSLQLIKHFTEALTSHIAISCGEMTFVSLGGFRNQWTYLLNGSPISELSTCIDDAGSLEVVVTKAVYNSLYFGLPEGDSIDAIKKESENYLVKDFKLVEGVHTLSEQGRNRFADLPQGKELSENLKSYIPRPVLYAISSGTLDTISELRSVTTMFLKLDSYNAEKHRDPLSLQPFFFMCQQILVKFGGFMRQFLVDDKGCVLIAMWGVPSFTYSNNCARAVSAAINIHRGTKKMGHACSIGITHGNVFCGNIGSLIRRDFVGIGSEVNLAARYMSKARGKIFLAENTIKFLPLMFQEQLEKSEGLVLKGVKGLSYAYIADGYMRLEIVTAGTGKSTFVQNNVRDPLIQHMNKVVPHQSEKNGSVPLHRAGDMAQSAVDKPSEWLRDTSSEVYPTDELYLAIVEGASGSGKTGVSSFFVSYATKCRLFPIVITARPSDRVSMHGMLKKLFHALVGSKRFDGEAQQKRVCKLLIEYSSLQTIEAKDEMRRLSSALDLHWEAINPDDVPILSDRHYLASLNSTSFKVGAGENISEIETHNNNIEAECNVLAAVIQVLMSQEPYAVVFEDAHFYNESSWKGMYALLCTHVVGAVLITAQISFSDRDNRITEQVGSSSSQNTGESRKRSNSSESSKGIRNWLGSSYKGVASYVAKLSNKISAIKEEEDESGSGGLFGGSTTSGFGSRSASRDDSSGGGHSDSTKHDVLLDPSSFKEKPQPSTPTKGSPTITKGPGSPQQLAKTEPGSQPGSSQGSPSGRKLFFESESPSKKYGSPSLVDGSPGKKSRRKDHAKRLAPVSLKKSQSARGRRALNKRSDVNAHHTEAYHRMRRREATLHIELQPLNFDEVKLLVSLESGNDDASFPDELIQIILEASSGNAFWARTIANFIMEYGQDEFLQNNTDRNNALTTLIVCRLEKLTTEQQVVLKNAAVVGEEFSTEMLQFGLPRRILAVLDESLAALTEHNFIVQTAHDIPIYTFPNVVFRNILYNLTPPRERSKFHRNLAEQMEGLHAHDLEEYYPL